MKIVLAFQFLFISVFLQQSYGQIVEKKFLSGSFRAVRGITITENKIWAITDGGLLVTDQITHDYKAYTVTDGLPTTYSSSIAHDSYNNIWIGTNSGLVKFDGNNFFVYDTHNSKIFSDDIINIKIDDDNNIWVLSRLDSRSALTKYDGTVWVNYEIKSTNNQNPNRHCTGLELITSTDIWCTSADKIFHFDGVSFEEIVLNVLPPPNFIWGIASDKNGNFWLSGDFGQIFHFDRMSKKVDKTIQIDDFQTLSIAVDFENKLWVSGSMGVWEINESQITKFDVDSLVHYPLVGNITKDTVGSLWLGCGTSLSAIPGAINSGGGGIIQLDPVNGEFISTYLINGPLTGNISDIDFDQNGGVYYSTSYGLAIFKNDTWTYYNRINPDFKYNQAVIESEINEFGEVFSNMGYGIAVLKENQWKIYDKTNALSSNFVSSISMNKKGKIYLGMSPELNEKNESVGGGLYDFDGSKSNQIFFDDYYNNFPVMDVETAGEDYLWMLLGTIDFNNPYDSTIVFRKDENEAWKHWSVMDKSAWEFFQEFFVQDSSTAFVVSNEWRIVKITNEGQTDYQLPVFIGLPPITSIRLDSLGVFWIGTTGGLLIYENDSTYKFIKNIQGLSSNNISHLNLGRNNTLIVSTDQEIAELNKSDLTNVKVKDRSPQKTLPKANLIHNYPNPFNSATQISFSSNDIGGFAILNVYSILGQLVYTEKKQLSGHNGQFTFSNNDLPSGTYLYSVQINGVQSEIKKMILLK